MGTLFIVLAIIIWVMLGAIVGLFVGYLIFRSVYDCENPYGKLLDKPFWIYNVHEHEWFKYRIVAVSHKGSISVRDWYDKSGMHAFWVSPSEMIDGYSFEDPEKDDDA